MGLLRLVPQACSPGVLQTEAASSGRSDQGPRDLPGTSKTGAWLGGRPTQRGQGQTGRAGAWTASPAPLVPAPPEVCVGPSSP